MSELQRLADLGLVRIKNPPREPHHLVDPYDWTQFSDQRARSWLHINCAGCHRFNGGGVVPLHLNYEKRLGELRALNERPTRGDFGLDDARIVAYSSPYRSTLFYRVLTEGAGHMPPIGSRLADPEIAPVLSRWITGLTAGSAEESASQSGAVNYTFHLGSRAAELVRDLFTNAPGQLSATNRSDALWLMDKPSGAFALFYRLAINGLSPETKIALARLTQGHTNALVRDLFQSLLPPGERQQTLGPEAQPQSILALNGDAARGREIFAGVSQCARCHTCAGTGRAFGPDLTGIGKKYDRTQLLDHILNPSKFIVPEFKTISVTLRDDTELSGFVLKRSATELLLRDETLKEHSLKLSDVKEQRESTLSVMPEGLLAPLTAQEAADLLEFLATNR
jgi:putative heme-binding domain-containing protein